MLSWSKANSEVERLRERLEEVRGRGEAAGGLVVIETGADGRVLLARLRPQVMRLGSEDLAEAIVGAVNAALDDVAAQTRTLMADVISGDPADAPGAQPVDGPESERGRAATARVLQDLDDLFGRL